MDEETIRSMIDDAIAARDGMLLLDCGRDIQLIAQDTEQFPEGTFEYILELLSRRSFLELDESHALLLAFEMSWKFISDNQKGLLLTALEASYTEFSDWMSWFVISELLGQYFNDRQALDVLRRLQSVEAEHPRCFVPHGLEHIAGDSLDETLRIEARRELEQMKNDPSEKVRDEVEGALHLLAARKYKLN